MPGVQSQPSLQALGLIPGARRRAWSMLLILALALGSFMHVAHSHDANAPATFKQQCAFCGMFDRGGTPPPAIPAVLPVELIPTFVLAPLSPPPARTERRASCRPRAPPLLLA